MSGAGALSTDPVPVPTTSTTSKTGTESRPGGRHDQRAAAVELTRLLDELDPPTRDPLAPLCWRCSAVSIEQLPYVTCEQLGCEALA